MLVDILFILQVDANLKPTRDVYGVKMQKIIDYFKNEPKVLIISCVTLFLVVFVGLAIILIRKKRSTRQAEAQFFDEYVAQTTAEKTSNPAKNNKKNQAEKKATSENKETNENAEEKTETAENPASTDTDNQAENSTKSAPVKNEVSLHPGKDDTLKTNAAGQEITPETKENKAVKAKQIRVKKDKQNKETALQNDANADKTADDDMNNISKIQNSLDEEIPVDTRSKEMKTTKNTSKSKPTGKWIIYSYLDEKKTRLYTARLKASNGETLLDMESYTTLNGVKAGLETVRKNISANNITYKGDKNNNWNFKIYSSNKMLLCLGEGYTSRLNCESAIESVKKFSEDATVVDMTPEENAENLEVRLTAPTVDLTETPDNVVGKWVIKNRVEDGKTWYSAVLKASNGVVILKTESYASAAGIQSGINTIKKNIAANNFEIKEDKNGNWNFKLYNARKMLLCVGEGYASRVKCESAVNSVRRFSKHSTVVETA